MTCGGENDDPEDAEVQRVFAEAISALNATGNWVLIEIAERLESGAPMTMEMICDSIYDRLHGTGDRA